MLRISVCLRFLSSGRSLDDTALTALVAAYCFLFLKYILASLGRITRILGFQATRTHLNLGRFFDMHVFPQPSTYSSITGGGRLAPSWPGELQGRISTSGANKKTVSSVPPSSDRRRAWLSSLNRCRSTASKALPSRRSARESPPCMGIWEGARK